MNRRDLLQTSALLAADSLLPKHLRAQAATPTAPIADTTSGKIRGFTDQSILIFKSIPYGEDTTKRRFQPPAKPTPWFGIRDCLAFGPQAPQPIHAHEGRSTFSPLDEPSPTNSEDCLRLNIWTPSLNGKRPVLVYIHGGAYSSSSPNGPVYDGVRLARRGDVVVVTLTHRLNLFGYLYLSKLAPPPLRDTLADSGNIGQLDLVFALKWVSENIARFGGDPSRVLIFGQSGGGAKCATLMAMPSAHGLFHRVWTMSGQQLTATTPEHATATARSVLKDLNLTPANLADILDPGKVPMEKLVSALRGGRYFGPVHDGRALPNDPFSPEAPAISEHIPMVLGNTHDETRLLIGASNHALFSLTWEQLPAELEHYRQFLGTLTTESIIADYRKWYPAYSPSGVFFAVTTAFRSWHGMVIESERRIQSYNQRNPPPVPGETFNVIGSPTWVYNFTWKSPADGGKWGAPHTIDIPFAFDNLDLAASMVSADGIHPSPEAQRLANAYADTLIAFARHGNPNNPSIPQWPNYNLDLRPTLLWDTRIQIEDDPRHNERLLMQQASYIQPGT